jgi:hypothetical protein
VVGGQPLDSPRQLAAGGGMRAREAACTCAVVLLEQVAARAHHLFDVGEVGHIRR